MNTPQNIAQQPQSDDLLALIRAVRLMWKHKKLIALVTLLFTVGGVGYALLAEPVYVSTAIIAPKESKDMSGTAGMLASLGDAGALLASQMGGSGTTMEKIAIIAKSHDLAESLISRYKLMPFLFHKQYDFKNNCWKIKNKTKIPTIKHGVKVLSKNVFSATTDIKKNVITLKVSIYDSLLAARIANYYIDELDNKIRSDVIREAKTRRKYLDAQMKSTADPWVMQKLQTLVGMEMEKSMMVAGSSFQVLETPMVPIKKTKPKRRDIILVFFCVGFLFISALVYTSDFVKSTKNKYSAFFSDN